MGKGGEGGGAGNLRAAEGNEGGCELEGSGERSQHHRTRKNQLRNTPRRRDIDLVPTGETGSPRSDSVRTSRDVVRGQGYQERQKDGAGEGDDGEQDQG